jgi:hypothetical protein
MLIIIFYVHIFADILLIFHYLTKQIGFGTEPDLSKCDIRQSATLGKG